MKTVPLFSWLIMAALAISSGCAAPRQCGNTGSSPARTYCLRGLWDVFSTGLDDLAEELCTRGVRVEVLSGPRWPKLVDQVAEDHLRTAGEEPLILIGHSYGADNAVRAADRLATLGIGVDLLVLIDGSSPPPIPSNVRRCVHYYRPTAVGAVLPQVFPGQPVRLSDGNQYTVLVNQIVSPRTYGERARHLDHFNFEAHELVHDLCIREILAIHDAAAPPARFASEPESRPHS